MLATSTVRGKKHGGPTHYLEMVQGKEKKQK